LLVAHLGSDDMALPLRSHTCGVSWLQQPFSRKGHTLRSSSRWNCRAYKVEIEKQGGTECITVEAGSTILQAALDEGIDLPHDCKMGVCMTCPARLVSASSASLYSLLSAMHGGGTGLSVWRGEAFSSMKRGIHCAG
jgi:hypothetical protein